MQSAADRKKGIDRKPEMSSVPSVHICSVVKSCPMDVTQEIPVLTGAEERQITESCRENKAGGLCWADDVKVPAGERVETWW
jgi:hypothetical protein